MSSTTYKQLFLYQSNLTHGNTYSYDILPDTFVYNSIVPIICSKHGTFYQKARQHAKGSNCQQCAQETRYLNNYNKRRHTISDFIAKAKSAHGEYYDYSNSIYLSQMKPITIRCPKHGNFAVIANNHINGSGCNKCKRSRGETKIINILVNNQIEFETQKGFPTLRMPDAHIKSFNHPKYDFFLPDYNLLIEFDGKHHFTPVQFQGVTIEKAQQLHDRIKLTDTVKEQFASENGIQLQRISYLEFDDIERIILDIITKVNKENRNI